MQVKQAENTLGEGFLSAADLLVKGVWKEFKLKIKTIHPANTVRADNKQLIDRPVIVFEKAKKMFAPSKTTQKLIRYQTGVDISGSSAASAIGQTITLYPVVGNWFKFENLSGIRVRIDKEKPKPMVKAKDMGRDITGQTYKIENVGDVQDEANSSF